MNHLSPEQLVDLLEGRAEPASVTHAATCDACREAADDMREALALAGLDGAPEPSPLFWAHFGNRVGAAVREEAASHARRASWAWRWVPASALAAAVLVAAFVVLPRDAALVPDRAAVGGAGAAATDVAPLEEDLPAAPDDASWMLMSDLSQEMTAEDAGTALPGTADRALRQLSDAERAALVEIIREEMTRASARSAEPAGE
jgi:hypothetical protein